MTDDEQIKALKTAYAEALLRSEGTDLPAARFKAALTLYPKDNELSQAIKISSEWPNDPFVIAEMERLLKERGSESFLPTKIQLAAQLWAIGSDPLTRKSDRIEALLGYGKIMDMIPKPSLADANGNAVLPTFIIKKYEDA